MTLSGDIRAAIAAASVLRRSAHLAGRERLSIWSCVALKAKRSIISSSSSSARAETVVGSKAPTVSKMWSSIGFTSAASRAAVNGFVSVMAAGSSAVAHSLGSLHDGALT